MAAKEKSFSMQAAWFLPLLLFLAAVFVPSAAANIPRLSETRVRVAPNFHPTLAEPDRDFDPQPQWLCRSFSCELTLNPSIDADGRQSIGHFPTTPADYARVQTMYQRMWNPPPPPPTAEDMRLINRYTAGWGLMGSTIEMGVGALASSAYVGVPVLAHGTDHWLANAEQLWTGESQQTLTHQAVAGTASYLGAGKQAAQYWGMGVDMTASLASGFVRMGPGVTTTLTADLEAGTGFTDKFGNMTLSSLGTDLERAQLGLHEGVHSLLSPPESSLLGAIAADLRMGLYQNSQLYRFAEEAAAESFAQLGTRNMSGLSTREALAAGADFPMSPFYQITTTGMAREAALVGSSAIAVGTGLYLWGNVDANGSGVILSKH